MTQNQDTFGHDQETFTVPVIDPDTGDGWDEEIRAGSWREAAGKVGTDLHVASSYIRKHRDGGFPDD